MTEEESCLSSSADDEVPRCTGSPVAVAATSVNSLSILFFMPLVLDSWRDSELFVSIISVCCIFLLAFTGWLAGSYEAAMQCMSISRLEDLIKERGKERNLFLTSILENPTAFRFSSAFVSGLCYGAFLLYGFSVWTKGHSEFAPVVLRALVLLLCMAVLRGLSEMTGDLMAERLVLRMAWPMWIITLPFRWISSIVYGLHRLLARGAGYDVDKTPEDLEDEVIAAVTDGELAGVVNVDQREMIERVFDFDHTDVADIFTPRTEMCSVEINVPLAEAIEAALDSGHSRLPVHDQTRDNVIGVFYVRDALRFWEKKEKPSLKEIMKKPLFVPETKNVGELLQQMQKSHTQIAVVLDEYGGTAGLVTIEDVLEEIVGEIQDEYDLNENDYYIKSHNNEHVVADGNVHVSDINKELDDNIIPEDDDYETLGGFVLDNLGHIPKAGEEFMYKGLRVKIIAADERRVKRVDIRRELAAS